jgi:LysM repeat protein
MDLVALLSFLPLIIAVFVIYHLIFKQQLPSKTIGAMLTYFLGIIIIFIAVTWLINSFLAGWALDMINEGRRSEWQQVIRASENVFEDAFGGNNRTTSAPGTGVSPQPTLVQDPSVVIVTATPRPGEAALGTDERETAPRTGTTQHTVVTGDTLYHLAKRYNTTINAIMQANGLTSHIIHPGQVLTIPEQ